MIHTFTVITKMRLEPDDNGTTSSLDSVDLRLEVSKNMDKKVYLERDLPTKEAIKPITATLIQGLTVNIKMAHAKGWWNEVEHIKYIIDELGRAFAHDPASIGEGDMDDDK